MTFKIEKDIPTRKFYSPFCEVLDKLEVGDSMPGLTKKKFTNTDRTSTPTTSKTARLLSEKNLMKRIAYGE